MISSPFDGALDGVADLGAGALAKYLAVTGWEMVRENSGVSSVWSLPGENASLMLPADPEFGDYSRRLADALDVISSIHRVRGQALVLEIASASSDILMLRADQFSADGTIPLREAEGLLQGARKMLTAAALAAVSPKANFGPARPAAVKEFVDDDVRMGHTMHGSFIITILARIDEPENSEPTNGRDKGNAAASLEPADQIELSFNRRVMTTLATGLEAAERLFDPKTAGDLSEAVARGVSAQLVDSLVDLTSFEGVRAIDTTFKWSPSHSYPSDDVPTSVRLPQRDKDAVVAVRERLRARPTISDDQVIGQVVRLERKQDDDDGVVVVDGAVGRERKRILVSLPPSKYALATTAHEKREPVFVEGDIVFEKGSYRIQTPRTFEQLKDRAGKASGKP